MRRQISMQEANDKIFEICDQYKVPIVQYKENDIFCLLFTLDKMYDNIGRRRV